MSSFIPQVKATNWFRQFRSSRWFQQTYERESPWKNIDLILLGAVLLQSIVGSLTVYSATKQRLINQGFDQFFYVQRHVLFLIVAGTAMLLLMGFGHDWVREKGVHLFVIASVLLVLVLIAGAVSSGARLSFDFGPISFQPAELMKVAVLVFISGYNSSTVIDKVTFHDLTVSLLILGVPFILIMAQPDLGSASVLIAGVIAILIVAGAKRSHIAFFSLMVFVSLFVVIVVGVVDKYQLRRFEAWLHQDSNDKALQKIVLQVRFAKRAVSSGGFFGKGYLNGPLTNGAYIPVQFVDFPFSAIGEQFGMLGGTIVLALFGVILWRVWMIAKLSNTRFDQLFMSGYFGMLLFQVFQNIGMTLGMLPVSGLPLPLISYGGSHLLSSGILLGLSQSVYMRRLR